MRRTPIQVNRMPTAIRSQVCGSSTSCLTRRGMRQAQGPGLSFPGLRPPSIPVSSWPRTASSRKRSPTSGGMRRSQRLPAQRRHRRAAVRGRTGRRGRRGAARARRHSPPDQRVHPAAPKARRPAFGRPGHSHPARDSGPAARRGGPVQPGDSRPPSGHRGDGEDARQPGA